MKGIKGRPKVWVRGDTEDDFVFVLDAKKDAAVYVPKTEVRYVSVKSRFGRSVSRPLVPGRHMGSEGGYVVVWFAEGVEASVRPASLVDVDAEVAEAAVPG